jgi:7-keto-8-aminopelargonate synthetase-like enzyme
VRDGHPSPIVPIVLGDEDRALAASAALLERGLLVPAIRPPTVAHGAARLRVALSTLHSERDVERLLDALAQTAPLHDSGAGLAPEGRRRRDERSG